MTTPKTPTDAQTQDKMTWNPGDVEWTSTPAPPAKKTTAQLLADRVRGSRDGDDKQRR